MTRYYILKHLDIISCELLRKYENGVHYVFFNKKWYIQDLKIEYGYFLFKFEMADLTSPSARKYKEILFERVYSVLPS